MIILKIILLLLGLAFALFGYFIYFKEKFSLINGFDAGKKDPSYAKRVGLIEGIIGIVLLFRLHPLQIINDLQDI